MTEKMPASQFAPASAERFQGSDRVRFAVAPPNPLTSFVGREREVEQICALLQRRGVRLVTLTGPGGVGKTRLALRVAEALGTDFADGVAFVPLAPITDPNLVCPTIAHALGVRARSDRPPPGASGEVLRDRELLLILDNFEQVIEAAPQLTGLLATLPRPPHSRDQPDTAAALRRIRRPDPPTDASRCLGAARAAGRGGSGSPLRRSRPGCRPHLALTADNARAVAAICQRLDGLPLAPRIWWRRRSGSCRHKHCCRGWPGPCPC